MSELDRPILIMACPRSGSSMTAGVFHAHGVWVGTTRSASVHNAKGHFKNLAIRRLIGKLGLGGFTSKGELAEGDIGDHLRNVVLKDGYKGGPWLWKGSVMYRKLWANFHPTWVVCRRNKKSIFRSCRSGKVFGVGLTDNELRHAIDRHHEELDYLVENGAYEVDTAAVAGGDFVTIRRAIMGCGLDFDETKTEEFVDSRLWHY